ncbi:MAG: 4'-phosphopantetheinyl transferase superfamily protein [Candidatus Competibacteraceae bacterium]
MTPMTAPTEAPLFAARVEALPALELWLLKDDFGRLTQEMTAPLAALLSEAEHDRRPRYRREEQRNQFLCSRALLRCALSRHQPVAPTAWVFEHTAQGKLQLAPPYSKTGLRFNLSHTQDLIVCAVARQRTVGADAEYSRRPCDYMAIAQRYFTPSEIHALTIPLEAQRKARFFEFWTLKEAYVKALGHGLSYAFNCFYFILGESRITINDSLDPDADDKWTFYSLAFNEHYRIALCLGRNSIQAEPRISLYSLSIDRLVETALGFAAT